MHILIGDEAEEFLIALAVHDFKRRGLRQSEVLPDMLYWNTTGSEKSVEFPTIYIPKREFERIKSQSEEIAKKLTYSWYLR